MTEHQEPPITCSVCTTPGTGRYCASCGSPLRFSECAACKTTLAAGARYCHKCGVSVGKRRDSASGAVSPVTGSGPRTLVRTAAAIAAIALVSWFAGSWFKGSGSTTDATRPPLDAVGSSPANAGSRAPDISQLSPRERADRLFNRVMLLAGQGKTDSVRFFAPMALAAYEMLEPLGADERYDMGRIAEVAGALPLAMAQADTILAQNPDHVLGLVLAARIAALNRDGATKQSFAARLLAAIPAESRKQLPEYQRHAEDISRAVEDARRTLSTPAK
jgi:hypothetical protein